MDSRESAAAPLQQPQHPPPQQAAGGAPPPPGMMLGAHPPNSYMPNAAAAANNTHASPMINANSASAMMQNPRFPFNPAAVVNSGSKPLDSISYGDGSSGGFSIEPARKKRGRPRKYPNDGSGGAIALGLAPNQASPVVHAADSSGGTPSSDPPTKKNRGRPPGSGKKQLDALGAPGVGFTPHVILVKAGEDIASKIMAFSQQGPRIVCILSANGAICNVTLRQPAMSGGTVSYEGRYEIISLSGSFLLSENNGSRSRTGGLSVSLAGSDGRVLGGGVAGMLTAASPVQVIVGSFIADGKKPKSGLPSTPSPMLNFGGPVVGASPPSQGPSSESSDDNGNSPLNHGPYMNAGQPMHNMPMYPNMGWANSPMKMHPN